LGIRWKKRPDVGENAIVTGFTLLKFIIIFIILLKLRGIRFTADW